MKYTNAQIAKAIKCIIENAEMLDNALDVALRATEIEEQNKRYREALERLLKESKNYEKNTNLITFLEEALEQSE